MKTNDRMFLIDGRFNIDGRSVVVIIPIPPEILSFARGRRVRITDAETGRILLDRLPEQAAEFYCRDVLHVARPKTRDDFRDYRGLIELAAADLEPDGPPRIRKEYTGPGLGVWFDDRPPVFFEITNLSEL